METRNKRRNEQKNTGRQPLTCRLIHQKHKRAHIFQYLKALLVEETSWPGRMREVAKRTVVQTVWPVGEWRRF